MARLPRCFTCRLLRVRRSRGCAYRYWCAGRDAELARFARGRNPCDDYEPWKERAP
ncbi:MAG: hypothetical protein HY554_14420 [Elusimicrobia bacterium]|nr:hypothetical protein [Elusimicrobiota bacterium]